MKTNKHMWNSPSFRKNWVKGERKGRGLRILPKTGGYFVHVTSRTRGQEFLLGWEEKKSLLLRVRQWSEFSGIGVLTHCIMSNHFHLLLFVPQTGALSHKDIVLRLSKVWPEEKVEAWKKVYASQDKKRKSDMDQLMLDRMGDLPSFMRVIKQSFSNWYNHRNGCKGTFWEGRYRSVVVEHNPLALLSVAAYIDLNPVRAGLVKDPACADWCGYSAACEGDKSSRWGLALLIHCSRGQLPHPALIARRRYLSQDSSFREVRTRLQEEQRAREYPSNWDDVQKAYRIWLYSKGRESSRDIPKNRKGISPQEVLSEYEKNGEIPHAAMLQHKCRCFTRGVGIGSPEFLNQLFNDYRSCFGPNRKEAASKMKEPLPGVTILRQVD